MIRQVFWKPDVIVVIEPPLFCVPTAWLCARLSGARCWLHIQDFEVDAAFDLGIIPFVWMKRMVGGIERWLMRCFDRVSTISGSMARRLIEKGVKQEKALLFPNWADIQNIRADAKGALAFRRMLDIPELQPTDRLAGMLSAAYVHLVVQKAHAADLVMPSKLTNILAVGGYAIVTAKEDTELGQLARAHPGVFETCPPDDADTLARLIGAAAEAGRETGIFNATARQYAENYLDRGKILTSFEAEVEDIVRSGDQGQ